MKIQIGMIEPPYKMGGAAARWYSVLVRELLAQGHELRVFATSTNPRHSEAALADFLHSPRLRLNIFPRNERRTWTERIRHALRPYSYHFSSDFLHEWKKSLSDFNPEFLHLEQLWSTWLMPRGWENRTLINIHHLISIDLGERPRGVRRLFRTEKQLVRRGVHFRVCSPRLSPFIRRWNPRAVIAEIPIGFDANLYPIRTSDGPDNTHPTLTVIGSMGWFPSRSAAERLITQILPRVQKEIPLARAQIVGWEARTRLAEHALNPDVELIENVPDPIPYFQKTDAFVYAPARGSGMKIKILEALALGIPIVTTSEGVEGLGTTRVDQIRTGESDDEIARAVIEVLRSPDARATLRAEGRKLIERVCSPVSTVAAIRNLYMTMKEKQT